MDEFPGILSRDFGLRPQGKAAPMSASRTGVGSTVTFGSGAGGSPFPGDLFGGDHQINHRLRRDDDDIFFRGGSAAPPKYASAAPAFSSDPFFSTASKPGPSSTADSGFSSSMPVFDKPVYDDDGDIFGGVPGMKKTSSASASIHSDVFSPPVYEDDLLASLGSSGPGSRGSGDNGRPGTASNRPSSTPYDDDLLGGFGKSGESKGPEAASDSASSPYDDGDLLASLGGGKSYTENKRSGGTSDQSPPSYEDDLLAGLGGVPKRSSDEKRPQYQGDSAFDDLIPGFSGGSPPKQKSGPSQSKQQQSSVSSTKSTVNMAEDPFVVLESASATNSSSGTFADPLEHISKQSGSKTSDASSATGGGPFDDLNGFDGLMKSMPSFSSDIKHNHNGQSPLEAGGKVSAQESSIKATANVFSKTVASHDDANSEAFEPFHGDGLNFDANASPYDASSKVNAPGKPEGHPVVDDDVWLTVSEIHLFTQPTSAPPPSRSPPPAFRNRQKPFASQDEGSSVGFNARRNATESSFPQPTESHPFQSSHNDMLRKSAVSSLDELEEFAMGKSQAFAKGAQSGEEDSESNSAAAASAAAMKQAMDRAEAKFKHAKEVRERERDLKSSKTRETSQEIGSEDEKERERLDREKEQREREEKEKEQRRVEKMRELELERERERERARQAVERATREARERAAAEARLKAERVAREQAERAAVQRAQAEVRERAAAEAKEKAERLAAEARERAEAEARERAAAEARERAAAEARERAARERAAREKAAVDTREKAERAAVERAAAEARARAQRAAVERANAEARERAAAEARERAAAMAREKQQKNETDLNSFFSMGARANSAPRERSTPSESAFDAQYQNKGTSDGNQRTSSVSSSNMRRPSSATNFMDDLTSVFRSSSYDEFQEVEGEPEERRRARLEREQRARQRAAKALAEKNERELQVQRDQAERDRVADTLNIEIRRWAAGKEGNLRALLSTLQYVLWPDSGWQPVSLTDLITGASVKKVYRKATLCVHPDKVVNGTVQQKYIAEKVFDLLKEAWNKFNSEELF